MVGRGGRSEEFVESGEATMMVIRNSSYLKYHGVSGRYMCCGRMRKPKHPDAF